MASSGGGALDDLVDIREGKLIYKRTKGDIKKMLQNIYMSNLPDVDLDESTIFGQDINILTEIMENCEQTLVERQNIFNVNATPDVEETANIYQYYRKQGTRSLVSLKFEGMVGTIIPILFKVKSLNGNQYRTLQQAEIRIDGVVYVQAESVNTGYIYDKAGQIIDFVDAMPGVSSVTNNADCIPGAETETDEQLQARIIESTYMINAIGTTNSLLANFKNIDGILDCIVLENATSEPVVENGLNLDPHSIAVLIVGGNEVEIGNVFIKKNVGCATMGNEIVTVSNEDTGLIQSFNYYRPVLTNFYLRIRYKKKFAADYNVRQRCVDRILFDISEKPFRLQEKIFADTLSRNIGTIVDIVDSMVSMDGISWNIAGSLNILQYPVLTDINILMIEEVI